MPTRYKRKNSSYRNEPHVGKKAEPTGTDADLNLATLSALFVDEDKAREFLEAKRWADGVICPHCGLVGHAYKLTAKPGSKRPVRKGVYKCKCRKQFTVRVGTIFEDSKLPLSKWLMAIHLMTSSKKGVSSHQIARELDVTVKTAWFVTMRIREAMRKEPMAGMLKGQIEMDEAYVGGKPRNKTRQRKGVRGATGRPNPNDPDAKQPVVVLVERDGQAVVHHTPRLTADNLRGMVEEVVDMPNSRLQTDEFRSYIKLGRDFGLGHGVVKHKDGEYARGEDHSNTAESFFALLKRGHYGIFHLLSKQHLQRYLHEFAFRWDHRKTSDGQRMVAAIMGAEGKRLMYKDPVAPTNDKAPV